MTPETVTGTFDSLTQSSKAGQSADTDRPVPVLKTKISQFPSQGMSALYPYQEQEAVLKAHEINSTLNKALPCNWGGLEDWSKKE